MNKTWRFRISMAYAAIWCALGLGWAARGDGNAMVHYICAGLQAVMFVVNGYLLHRTKMKDSPNEANPQDG